MRDTETIELPRMPDFGLKGCRALVSGASRGIGRGCAAALADARVQVTMLRCGEKDPDFKAEVLHNIKLGCIGQVEDVLGALVHLASSASALVMGNSLLADGSWTAE